MKKRILCAFLALMMLVSLVPVTAINASAASMKTSDAAIKFIKQYESYRKTCYADSTDGSRYSIGYGTKCTGDHSLGATHTIEEVDASAALAKELPAIEAKVNAMGLNLSQNQFDALVSFSYNNGTAWISGNGIFKNAVVSGKYGNEFIYAISLWSNGHEGFSTGLMKRRLAEANMYLNGVYSKTPPTSYTYVLFDANGGTLTNSLDNRSYRMQGYITGGAVAIKASATQKDKTFMGWYNSKGEPVNALTTDLAGQTLTARWQDAKNPTSTAVNYTMNTNSFVSLQPRADHKDGASSKGFAKLSADTVVTVLAEFLDTNGTRWVRIKDSGWVKINTPAVEEDKTPVGNGTVVTVTNDYINIRKEPSASSAPQGKVNYGDKLTLQEVVSKNGALWGKIEKGWIALMYTNYDSVKVEEKPAEPKPEDKVIATAVVKCEEDSYVNVRKGAGVGNTAVSSLRNGTKVELFEITTVDGHKWGRIASGWFCLDYAKDLKDVVESEDDTTTEEKEEAPAEVVIATGTVISNTPLNVRDGAGVNNDIVATKARGTALNIYEITSVNGHEWGRIGADQWVCLTYVNFVMSEGNEEADPETKPEASTGVALFTGTVTGVSTELTIRDKASYEGKTVGSFAPNAKISILEVASGKDKSNNAAVWGKVQSKDKDGKAITGWVCLTGFVTLDAANFTVISNTLNVRSAADASTKENIVDKLSKGTVVEITDLKFTTETSLWGYSEQYGGWMCITSNYMERTYSLTGSTTPEGDSSNNSTTVPGTPVVPTGIVATGVVNGVQLNVRSGPGFNSGKVNTLMPGSEINIYEYATADGMGWGRTDYGWVSLGYVLITSTGVTGHGQKATVANSYIGVNVRHEPTTNSTLMSKIMVNSRIEILELKTVNGSNWGRTLLGWVNMEYVLLDSDAGVDMDDLLNGGVTGGNTENNTETKPNTNANAFAYAGVTTAEANIYKNAGAGEMGNKIAKDQAVTVYEIAVDDASAKWVRIDEGWIKADCVKLNAIKQVYTVVSNTLNVRSSTDSSNKSNIVGKLSKNDVVEVTELEMSTASVWGKVTYTNDKKETVTGYICLGANYVAVGDVSVKEETPAPETTPTPAPGTGTGTGAAPETNANKGGILYTGTVKIWDGKAAKLKVRDTAGGKEIDALSPGVKVNIVDIAIINNMPWGKCGAGWICLTYVDLVPYNSTAKDAKVVLYTDFSYAVPVYEGAGTQYNKVASIAKGTVVDILEVSGEWVRTTQGWIQSNCLAPC